MKLLLLYGCIAWCLFLSIETVACQENLQANGVKFISEDSTMNGYVLYNPDVLPFSPVIEPIFNLPDSSTVSIYLTDTLSTDTIWVFENKSLKAGLYNIPFDIFSGYKDITGNRIVKLHFEARSILNKGGILENWFRAMYIIPLP